MSDHDIWHVKLPSGDSKSGTLDQLDEAFQAGLINESTLVRREGTDQWVTLAQAAGIEEVPETLPEPVQSMAPPPVAMSVTDLDLPDPEQLRGSKKGVVLGVLAGVVVFAAAGIFAISHAESAPSAAAAAPPPAVADLNAAIKGGTTDLEGDGKGRTLTDAQRKALADADKAHEADAARRKAAAIQNAPSSPSKPIKQGNPFHSGGNKYDPLNGNL